MGNDPRVSHDHGNCELCDQIEAELAGEREARLAAERLYKQRTDECWLAEQELHAAQAQVETLVAALGATIFALEIDHYTRKDPAFVGLVADLRAALATLEPRS